MTICYSNYYSYALSTVCSGTGSPGIVILWNCDCGTVFRIRFLFRKLHLQILSIIERTPYILLPTLHCGSFKISTEPNRSNIRGWKLLWTECSPMLLINCNMVLNVIWQLVYKIPTITLLKLHTRTSYGELFLWKCKRFLWIIKIFKPFTNHHKTIWLCMAHYIFI